MSGIIRAQKPTKRREFNSAHPAGVVLNKKDIKSFRSLALEHRAAEFLYLRENQIEKFDPYILLENLKVLDLSINQLSGSVDFLGNCPFLRHLYLTGNRISTLNGISGFSHLETLCISDNAISSFDGLDALPNLRVLSLNFNNITSFRSFPFLPSLHTLNLVGNPLVDLPSYRSMAVALCAPTLVSIDGAAVVDAEREAVAKFAGKIVYCISEGFIVEEASDVDAAADKFLVELQQSMQKSKPLLLSSIRLASTDPKNATPTEGISVRLDVCLQDIRSYKERLSDTFYSRFLFPVQFKVSGNASEAFVVGSFNGWGDPLPLERVQDGTEVAFQTTLYLPPGVHEYRYVVDGETRVVENVGTSKFGQGACMMYHVAQAPAPEEDQDTILYIRWMRSDQNNGFVLIDEENSLVYTPTANDIGFSLRAEVLAYVKGEFSFLYFDISAPVVAGAPTCTRLEIKGIASEGEKLTVEADYTGGEEGSSSLQWFRVLPGTNEEVPIELEDPWDGYVPTLDDIGSRIKVVFTPVRSDWCAGDPRMVTTDLVAAGVPVCRGIRIVGQLEQECELTAETTYSGGTEGPSKFQWFRREDDDQYFPIFGETSKTYKPTLDDVGKLLAVEYTPTSKDGIEGEPCRCVLERSIDPAPPQIRAISIKGELEEQHVLVVEYDYFGGHSGTHLVQWFRRDSAKRSTKIGRSSASYTTTVAEVGCYIDVVLTPVRSDGVQGKPATASTDGVIRPGHPQVKALNIVGEPGKGNVLEVHVDYFGGEPGEAIIEWAREVPETRHFDIIAKKTRKYVIQQEDLGKMLKISYTPVRRDGVQGETKTRLIQVPFVESSAPQE